MSNHQAPPPGLQRPACFLRSEYSMQTYDHAAVGATVDIADVTPPNAEAA